MFYDPDYWEWVSEYRECSCGGIFSGNCTGSCNGMATSWQRPRAPTEVAKIKAAKLLAHEEAVLREADAIRARREASSPT